MAQPVNETQEEFERLCKLSGGLRGGPVKHKVQELLKSSGKVLNAYGFPEIGEHIARLPDANPWHVCFAMGMSWGRLSNGSEKFMQHAVAVLADWNDYDLSEACSQYLERGPEPIEQSLKGGYNLFQRVKLPAELPKTLRGLDGIQQKWLLPLLNPATRPRYIGGWNATAMFMTALFTNRELAESQIEAKPLLPTGGPIYNGLKILHTEKVLLEGPSGSPLDDGGFEAGVLHLDNQLLVNLLDGLKDCCLLDIHSGVYMLGTRDPRSRNWFQ